MKPKNILFSVIIPFLKNQELLLQLIISLKNQNVKKENYEVIVVDNSSNSILKELTPLNEHDIILVEEKRPGSYQARNTGAKHSKGKFLLFIDDDCIPHPDWLKEIKDNLERKKDYANSILAGEVSLVFSSKKATTLELFEDIFYFNQKIYVEKENYGVTANLIVSKKSFDSLNGFDSTLKSGGDKEFCIRAKERGLSIKYLPSAIVYHPTRPKLWDFLKRRIRIISGLIYKDYAQKPGGFKKSDYLFLLKYYNKKQILKNWAINHEKWRSQTKKDRVKLDRLLCLFSFFDRVIIYLCYKNKKILKVFTFIDRF